MPSQPATQISPHDIFRWNLNPFVVMCSSVTAFFLGIIALYFHFCTSPSVLALVPIVQEQSKVGSEWAQLLPGSTDSLEIENDGGEEKVVASIHQVCCTVHEPLIEKVFLACEGIAPGFNCDGTVYECPRPAFEIETQNIPKKCPKSSNQSASNFLEGAIHALTFPFIFCALAGFFADQGPRYNCFEGWW